MVERLLAGFVISKSIDDLVSVHVSRSQLSVIISGKMEDDSE